MALSRDILLRFHLWLLAVAAMPMIKWLPLKLVLRLMTPPAGFHPYRSVRAQRIVSLVDRRLANPRMMAHRPCLRRGLVLYHLLTLSGLPARLVFGVYPAAGSAKLRAHCWVMVDEWCAGSLPSPSLAVVWTHPGDQRARPSVVKCVASQR